MTGSELLIDTSTDEKPSIIRDNVSSKLKITTQRIFKLMSIDVLTATVSN